MDRFNTTLLHLLHLLQPYCDKVNDILWNVEYAQAIYPMVPLSSFRPYAQMYASQLCQRDLAFFEALSASQFGLDLREIWTSLPSEIQAQVWQDLDSLTSLALVSS